MSQISLPVRILLIGAVVFLAAWFTLLRPKTATVDASTTPVTAAATPQTGLGRAVASAKKAAGLTPTATATAAPAATATPATSQPDAKPVAMPATALAKLPGDVARALRARKVLVLGVLGDGAKPWRPLSDDDRYVRNSLRKVNRYDGQVVVKDVPVTKLATYGALVGDLDVSETPSVVVIDRDLKGTVLTGYVDRVAVNQVIQDARRASIRPYVTDPYLLKANRVCANDQIVTTRWSWPTVNGPKAKRAAFKREYANHVATRDAVVRLEAPKRWRSLKKAWVGVLNSDLAFGDRLAKRVKHNDWTGYDAAIASHDTSGFDKLDHRFDAAGLTSCSRGRAL